METEKILISTICIFILEKILIGTIYIFFLLLKLVLITSQGIEITISELTGPTDCSTDYLEVGHNFHLGSANFQQM